MGLLDGLGKWLKDEFDSITGQPQQAPVPTPKSTTVSQPQPLHAPLALPNAHPSVAPTASPATRIQLGQPQQTTQPPQIKLQANSYPHIDPNIKQTIVNSPHLNAPQKQAMLQRVNNDAPVDFNPIKATAQSLVESAPKVAAGIVSPIANTVKVPIDAAILGGAKLAGNKYVAQAAQDDLGQNIGNNMFNNSLTQKAGDLLATAAFQPFKDAQVAQAHQDIVNTMANAYGNTPAARNYADEMANANDQQIYNTELAQQGLTPNDNLATVAWRTGAPVVAGLLQAPLMAAGGGAGAEAAEQGLLPVLKTAVGYGATGAGTNVLATAADPNATPLDYAQAAATGFTGGVAMPLAGAAIRAGTPLLAAATRAGAAKLSDYMTTPAAHVAEQASGLSRDNVLNDNDTNTLRDYADWQMGDRQAITPGDFNVLDQRARHAAETAGIDVTHGSPSDIASRIENYISQRYQFIKAHDSFLQGGYARVPFLEEGETEVDPLAQEYAAEKSPQEIAQEHADMLRSMDASAKGGVITENGTRVSEHTPFYREYFAEHGRAPSKAAYLEQATKELEGGNGDMLDPGMAEAYQLAKQREAASASLVDHPYPEVSKESYYYGESKNPTAFTEHDELRPVVKQPRDVTDEDVNRVFAHNPMLPENAPSQTVPERSANLDREAQYILQNGGTPDEAANVYIQGANKTYGDALREVNRVARESKIDLGEQNPAMNPLYEQVNLPKATNWQQAVLNADAITKNIADLHNVVTEVARGMSQHDLGLLDRTRNEPIEQLARQANKPDQFIQVATAAKNLNDYTQEVGRMVGQNVSYRPSYGARMFYDLTDPESARAYEAYKASLKSKPGYGQRRNISTYEEAASLGIKRAHGNYLEDLMHDAVSRGNDLAQLTLAKSLDEAYPGQVKVGEIGYKPQEGTYEQLRVAHGNRLSVPKALADEINARAPYQYQHGGLGRALRTYDTYNGLTKFFKLSLGGFHNFVELSAFTARSILHGDLSGIIKNIETIGSKAAFDKEMSGFQSRGVLEKAHFAGLTTSSRSIAADAGGKIHILERGKYNPLRVFHEALFQRQIPYAKLRIFEDETKNLNIKNEADVVKMRAAARALNNAFGGVNRLVDGLTPVQSKLLSRAVLALDYNESQARSLINALSKGGVEGRIARQVVVGRMVLLAAPGIVAYSLQQGVQNDPVDILKRVADQILDPHIPLPFTSASGINRVGELPANVAGKVFRAVEPFFDENETDKLSGVKHELSGNMASGSSSAIQLATNKDYYGQPIITTDPDTGKINIVQSASNVAGQFEPISGGQVQKVVTGQESPAEAAVNTIGIRTKSNPDDPRIKILNNRTKVVNGLSPQDQSAIQLVHPSWGNLPKDQQSAIYSNPHFEEQKWDTMLSNQDVFDALKKQDAFAAQHGQPANPLFALNPQDAKTIMTYEWLKHADPGTDANNTAAVIYNENQGLIQKFEQDNANYGAKMNQLYQQTNGLKGDNTPVQQIGGAPTYHPDAATQTLVNQYYTISDPKTRAQFLVNHPEMNNYFEAVFQSTNQVRASLGEPLLKDYPQADKDTQSFMNRYMASDAGTRSSLRNANPNLYGKMQSYLEQVDEYNVAKYAGQAQFQGQELNQNALKAIYGLGNYDMVKNPDGTYALTGSNGVQPGALKIGGTSGSRHKMHRVYMKPAKRVKVYYPRRAKKISLQRPPSPIKIHNKVSKHVGIKRTTYL